MNEFCSSPFRQYTQVEVVFFSLLFFSAIFSNIILADLLRKKGQMAFMRYSAFISSLYVPLFIGLWLLGLVNDVVTYFLGKLLISIVILIITINEFKKTKNN